MYDLCSDIFTTSGQLNHLIKHISEVYSSISTLTMKLPINSKIEHALQKSVTPFLVFS